MHQPCRSQRRCRSRSRRGSNPSRSARRLALIMASGGTGMQGRRSHLPLPGAAPIPSSIPSRGRRRPLRLCARALRRLRAASSTPQVCTAIGSRAGRPFPDRVLQYCTSSFMPEQQTLFGFDLVFAPDEHVFTVTAHFNNWNRILWSNELPGYSRILKRARRADRSLCPGRGGCICGRRLRR